MGHCPLSIEGGGDHVTARWRWVVHWRAEVQGVVSTGLYSDRFEKGRGRWKCLERVSDIDSNWPAQLFQPMSTARTTSSEAPDPPLPRSGGGNVALALRSAA